MKFLGYSGSFICDNYIGILQYLIAIIIAVIILLNRRFRIIYTIHSPGNRYSGCFQFCGIKIQNKEDSIFQLCIWSNCRSFGQMEIFSSHRACWFQLLHLILWMGRAEYWSAVLHTDLYWGGYRVTLGFYLHGSLSFCLYLVWSLPL